MDADHRAPRAKKIAEKLTAHGDTRIDNYYWLKELENPEVVDYLRAENEYTAEKLRKTQAFQRKLFDEMKARIEEDDESVPYKHRGYWYICRYGKNCEYPIYTRKKETLDAAEALLFDVDSMAVGQAYYHLDGICVSPDNRMAAFGVDSVGRRAYTLRVKNIETGAVLSDRIENTTGSSAWANDNQTLFYTRRDAALRPYRIYKHKLGRNPAADVLVYEEKDPAFSVCVDQTKSQKYIVIQASSTLSQEYRILAADDPDGTFRIFQRRERGLEYHICHCGDAFYILTNQAGATNFKVVKTPESDTVKENWIDVVPHRADTFIEDMDVFGDYLVIEARRRGLVQIDIHPWHGVPYCIDFDEPTYAVRLGDNCDFDTDVLRYVYTSLTTPVSVVDFNMKTRRKTLKKRQAVLGGFNQADYRAARVWAPARDGEKIPVSLVYSKTTVPSPDTPLLLYGYGSYGCTIDPHFSSLRLSLLNRGFVYAIAHIRGGQYLGRPWYTDGKLFNKKNTFTDFIDVGKFLIDQRYTAPRHLYAVGASAGGLLIGAVLNEAAALFHGSIARVPFVDVVTTMLDESIPLTTEEYDEWGDPNDRAHYAYMKSYSPYDNVTQREYPHLLVTTALHDSQVQYWEPAKWVAKLREFKKGNRLLLLKTDMDAGHSGASGRFESLKETALEYAFLLDLAGIDQ